MKFPPSPPYAVTRFSSHDTLDFRRDMEWRLLSEPSAVLMGVSPRAPRMLEAMQEDGSWFGFLGYELGEWTEEVPRRPPCDWGLPDFWVADFRKNESFLPELESFYPARERSPIESSLSVAEHTRRLSRIRDYLRAGDIYQANLTVRFEADGIPDPWRLFLSIAQRSQAPYTAFLDAGDWKILSFSPELFIRKEGNRIRTNPIKGTIGRMPRKEEDRLAVEWLLRSEKNLAELLMIVDLERNDIGRVCKSGSLAWGPFPNLVSLPNVHHLCCPVSGVLREHVSLVEILKATFPGGSISGAPKRRALQILRELEPHRRGPYCGAIGYASSDRMLLNVGIRTGVWKEGKLRFWGGGGIVADSDSEQEQAEIRSKLEPFSSALGVSASEFWRSPE